MNIRNTILGLLMDGPRTGYELKRIFDSSLGFFAGASFGSIYPILNRCRRDGFVRMEVEHQDGRPSRKVYSLTPGGRNAFIEAMGEDLLVSPYRNEFLTRLFFFTHLDADRRAGCVEKYLRHLRGRLEAVEAVGEACNACGDPFQRACQRFGVRHLREMIRNVEQLRDEISGTHEATAVRGKEAR